MTTTTNSMANMGTTTTSEHVHGLPMTSEGTSSAEVDPNMKGKMGFSIITIRLPQGHTSKGLRGDLWGFNNFLAFDEHGAPMQIIESSSGGGDLSKMNALWLHKDHDHFWAKVESHVAVIACATQGAQQLNVSVKGATNLQLTSSAVHWSDSTYRDGGEWSSAHNRPDHFQEWAYNVVTISNVLSSRFSRFSEIVERSSMKSEMVEGKPPKNQADSDFALCGKIHPTRVRDVQWSGNVEATTEEVYYSGTPFIPGVGHVSVTPDDYFTLSKSSGTNYQLKQHGSDGHVKIEFDEGEVKANSDVVFYIVAGWYGTVITKESDVNRYSAFSSLKMNPKEPLVAEACVVQQVHGTMTTTIEQRSKVRGVLYLSMAPTESENTYLNIDTDSATRKILSDTIADAYGLSIVSILSVARARRLRATGLIRLHVIFEGVGLATPMVSQSGLSIRLQQHFEPYGWKIQSASIEIEGRYTDTPLNNAQQGVQLIVICAMVIGALSSMAICGVVFACWRRRKNISTNTIFHDPKVKGVESNPCILDSQPVTKMVDNETTSEPSNEVSTNVPSSEDSNAPSEDMKDLYV